ncbi:MAG: flavodoxin family protein, partial [Ruminococcaceae bacterium]|nr:flavodoxin family protein [Oscillospiraceae bacterium]
MKKILILTSSPRKNGNTNALVKEVAAELAAASKDISCEVIDLAEADIKPCLSCR